MSTPRAYTPDEVVETLLAHFSHMVDYWDQVNTEYHDTQKKRMEGLVHSILTSLDGYSGGMPCGFDLVCTPHPDDQDYHRAEGSNWYPPEGRISVCLHERWGALLRRKEGR